MAGDPAGTLTLLALHLEFYIYSWRVRWVCNQHSLRAQFLLASIHEKPLGNLSANRFGGGDEAGTKEVSLESLR